MEEKNNKITNEELLEVINEGFSQMEERMNTRFNKIEASMVTKDYLDDKLADMKGEVVILTRQEDKKLCTLVDTLQQNKTLNTQEAEKIMAMEPFQDLGLSLKK